MQPFWDPLSEEEFMFIWEPTLGKEDAEVEWLCQALLDDGDEED